MGKIRENESHCTARNGRTQQFPFVCEVLSVSHSLPIGWMTFAHHIAEHNARTHSEHEKHVPGVLRLGMTPLGEPKENIRTPLNTDLISFFLLTLSVF